MNKMDLIAVFWSTVAPGNSQLPFVHLAAGEVRRSPRELTLKSNPNYPERKIRMKRQSHFSRASSMLILLLAVSLPAIAQLPTTRQQQPVQQQEPQVRELAVQQLDSETLRVRVPQECARIKPLVQKHTAVSLSPALTSYLSGKPVKGYNDPAVNKFVGDSFELRSCRICYATLEVNVEHYGDVWTNDSLTVGVAPFSGSGSVFVSGAIWSPATPNPKTITWALSPGLLNTYLMSGPPPPKFVDFVAQDDTNFHSATLSVWYY